MIGHRGCVELVETMAGRSGYPKISGRVFWILGISRFQKYYPKLARVKKNPKIRVRVRVYPNNPNQNHPVQYATARAWRRPSTHELRSTGCRPPRLWAPSARRSRHAGQPGARGSRGGGDAPGLDCRRRRRRRRPEAPPAAAANGLREPEAGAGGVREADPAPAAADSSSWPPAGCRRRRWDCKSRGRGGGGSGGRGLAPGDGETGAGGWR